MTSEAFPRYHTFRGRDESGGFLIPVRPKLSVPARFKADLPAEPLRRNTRALSAARGLPSSPRLSF